MFRRLRQLEISLAAKCQLLFGAAVVLILGAALFVPWQRMEQLTEQINERSAKALAETAKAQHLLWASKSEAERRTTPMPSRMAGGATTLPVNADGRFVAVPQWVARWNMPAKPPAFDRRSLEHFTKHPNFESYSQPFEMADGSNSVHFALALRAEETCVRCHSEQIIAAGLVSAATTQASQTESEKGRNGERASTEAVATTAPVISADTLIGLVTLEMKSQVDTSQLLLNRIFLLTAGLLAGTLAILVFYLITNKLILQPVRVLRETAEKVSKGDLNVRSHIFTGDEFQHLSETFNVMLANLKESEDQLRAINKSLDLKMGQLAESNVALYESNRLKSEFLANVSHELRTPLNSILGFAELLRDTGGDKADARSTRYLQNILNSGRNLLELINDLLDLAKIEAGRMEVRSAPLPLNDLFEGLTGILKPLSEKKNLTILTAIAGDVPILQTDAAKLQQVLYNFLSNAIKFSPVGGQIDLTAERVEDGRVRISVTDRGPGIDLDKQQMIFEKFRQIDGSVTREHGGTGLGLAISKELIGLMGGVIGVRSTPGDGATFWIVLPVRIEAGALDVRAGLVLT
ncbi:MAG: putative two-component system sensor histidine kinase [Phycisphaerales bacterium]|nr:putative two-component system sensor histidine kinase [Phycisphaerales bacterium]